MQRRLASSPEAIYQSLKRRRERLEKRLREERIQKRGGEVRVELLKDLPSLTTDDLDELADAPTAEVEETAEQVVDQASAAQTIAELESEIATLNLLEALAMRVRRSGTDRKWEELSQLLQNHAEMFDPHGHRRKLVVFTEHRDTPLYLAEKIRGLFGRAESVVTIHGGMGREERHKAQEAFTQDKEVQILYGEHPEVRARLFAVVDNLADQEQCRTLLEERTLAHDSLDAAHVRRISEDLERAQARRLQPHFIASFFLEAFKLLGRGNGHRLALGPHGEMPKSCLRHPDAARAFVLAFDQQRQEGMGRADGGQAGKDCALRGEDRRGHATGRNQATRKEPLPFLRHEQYYRCLVT